MRKTSPEWSQEIGRRGDSLVALRRDFHRHPELSFEERRTAEIIAGRDADKAQALATEAGVKKSPAMA